MPATAPCRDTEAHSRLDTVEADVTSLRRETERQTTILEALAKAMGQPPNPFGSSDEERRGSGLCRIAYEMNDVRRFALKTIAVVGSLVAGALVVAKTLKEMGVWH